MINRLFRTAIILTGLLLADAAQAADFGKVAFANGGASLLYGAVYVAADKGFFKEAGIEYDETTLNGVENMLNAVIKGDITFAMGPSNDVIVANSKGQKLRAIAELNVNFPAALVMKKSVADGSGFNPGSPLADRMKAMKGHTVTLTVAGGPLDTILRQMFRAARMDPDHDVTIVYSGNAGNVLTAIKADRVDAALTGSPTQEFAVATGKWVKWIDLFKGDFPPLKGIAYSTIYARGDYVDTHMPLTQAVVNALGKAEAYIQKDREGARAVLRKRFPNMEEAIFNAAFDTSYPSYPATPAISESGYAVAQDIVNTRPDQPKVNIPFAQAVDMRFVNASSK